MPRSISQRMICARCPDPSLIRREVSHTMRYLAKICSVLVIALAAAMIISSGASAALKSELNVAIPADPPSLDPHGINSNIVGGIGIHIYEPLFSLNAAYEPTPVLAESYEVSDDGLTYTIALRRGVKFHDGSELTADDVVASMNRWLAKSSKAELIKSSKFSAVDAHTVKLEVERAASDIITLLAAPIQFAAIYKASAVVSAGDGSVTEWIGTGPYKLVEWKQDQYVHLERFDGYVSPAGPSSGLVGEKRAPTKDIWFRVATDESTRIAGLKTGAYDIAEEIPLDRYAELAADKSLKMSVQNGGTLNLFLNTTKGPLANADMRQAVLAALDCGEIMLVAYGDESLFTLDPGWCPPSDALWGSKAGAEYYSQANVEKAKELLAKAGYGGEKITLVTTPNYASMYNATIMVQDQLKRAGMNAVVEQYDFAAFMERRASTDTFDMFITSNSYNPLPVQLSVVNPSWAGLTAPEVAAGVDAIRYAPDAAAASAEWQKLQTFIYEHGAATVLGHYAGVEAMRAGVEGYDYLRFPIYWNVSVSDQK